VDLHVTKTLNFDTPSNQPMQTDHAFPKETMQLVRILKKKSVADLRSLMGISEKLADLNVHRFKSFKKVYTSEIAKPAIEAFKGDVYLGLDYPTMDQKSVDYAQRHLRILSGLYGILKPLDKMQPYRLEMGTKLENKLGSNLYKFWGTKISKHLNKEMKEYGTDTILNLASNEYWKAVDQKALKGNIIEANFKEEKDGQLKFISFNAKKARGYMARFVMDNKITTIDHLKGFDTEGYIYNEEHSTASSLLFVR